MIIDGLRPQSGRSAGSGLQDADSDADVEEDYTRSRTGGSGRPKRRNHWENGLSVSLSFLPLSVEFTPI